ncbi:MAG TPA: nuclear transport factor 2 family protein [Terriglobia bacterium]|nr:nuclear transport factor 2 family protein [Terriglobia bacterium]
MTEADQVIEANLKFYFALESLDIDLMDEVWATDASASCIHPGRRRLDGWDAIRSTWERIFKAASSMRVDPGDVRVEIRGTVAWVTCMENITTDSGGQTIRTRAFATNVFVFEDERWLLVLHHASMIVGT